MRIHICAIAATLLVSSSVHAADARGFMDAADAYEHKDYARCADILSAMDHEALPLPVNGELFFAECLGAAGRVDAAIRYLDAQLPSGHIHIVDLRDKDRPGLDAIRHSPRWPALITRAETLGRERLARLDQPLREELLARADKDQQARRAVTDTSNETEAWKRVEPIDHGNTAWLKRVVASKGWPGITLVGADGAQAALLLVQHADADPAFQAQALALMKAALAKHDVAPADFALLTDRVLLAQGELQRYGTQFQTGDAGMMTLRPTQDEAGLDARRRAVGLMPMAEYKRMLQEMYRQPVK